MPETEAAIRISAVGGDEAAAALNKPIRALENIGGEHNKLVEKFSHRFSHVGLSLFAGEALRASGIGSETSRIIGIMNLGITSLGSAFGAAAGPVLLIASALTSLVAIAVRVVRQQQDLTGKYDEQVKALDKVVKKNQEAFDGFKKNTDVVKEYSEEFGRLTGFTKIYADSIERAALITAASTIPAHQAVISTLNEENVKIEDSIRAKQRDLEEIRIWATSAPRLAKEKTDKTNAEITKLNNQLELTRAKLKQEEGAIVALNRGYSSYDEYLKAATESHKKAREESAKSAEESIKRTQDIADAETARYQNWAELHAKEMEEKNKSVQTEADQETKRYQNWADIHEKQVKKNAELMDTMYKGIAAGVDKTLKTFSDAVAAMFVKGEKFTLSFKKLFEDMAQAIISEIIRMEIRWLVFQAITGGTGGFASGGSKAFGFAEGGSVMVNKPTLFLAGEAGQPELATFTPLSKMGGGSGASAATSGSSGGVQIGSINTNVYGVTDPDAIADKVGLKIAERIRGQGEINFTRPS